MPGWEHNSACILDYLELFQVLASEGGEAAAPGLYRELSARERETPESVPLAPRLLRDRLRLGRRDFLLLMAALAFELDGGLRRAFRTRYGLALPTVEYGLQLIEPLCPAGIETLAELSGPSPLCALLLTAAESTAYAMERPLVLCRGAAAFLTGLSLPELRGVSPRFPRREDLLLPVHEGARMQVRSWFRSGASGVLSIRGPAGSGRRTLVCRACGGAVCADMEVLDALSPLDRSHLCREAALLSRIFAVPLCAVSPSGREALGELEWLHRRFSVPLVVLPGDGHGPDRAEEVLRLPGRLTAREQEEAWRAFVPRAEPFSAPEGSMTIGALRAAAETALRIAGEAGRAAVGREDARRALRLRGGALSFGALEDPEVAFDDMVLPEDVLAQLRQICMAARFRARLPAWGIPSRREGVTAVFHGPSGTGKTMAAAAIARELGMPLLRADLSQIMDKYVGETEKHLAGLMGCARENRCVLLFDEADSLFGKRASLSGEHSKFANLSTSFLLQEIERYEGVALLSTNLLGSFDDAFLRRLHYIVRFTPPGPSLRERLWQRALPEERLEDGPPFPVLAQAELSPARIHRAVRAAAIAEMAAGKETISAAAILRALRLELEKSGKPLPGSLSALLAGAAGGSAPLQGGPPPAPASGPAPPPR